MWRTTNCCVLFAREVRPSSHHPDFCRSWSAVPRSRQGEREGESCFWRLHASRLARIGAEKGAMIPTSEVSKPWQSMGSPPTAFKPKKPFIPRLVRSKNPDHIIGYGSVFQVGEMVTASHRQAACCRRVRYVERIACALSEKEKAVAQVWSVSVAGLDDNRRPLSGSFVFFFQWMALLIFLVICTQHTTTQTPTQKHQTYHTASRIPIFFSLCLGYTNLVWTEM